MASLTMSLSHPCHDIPLTIPPIPFSLYPYHHTLTPFRHPCFNIPLTPFLSHPHPSHTLITPPSSLRPALQYLHFYGANPHVRAGPKAAKLMNRFPNHGSSYRGDYVFSTRYEHQSILLFRHCFPFLYCLSCFPPCPLCPPSTPRTHPLFSFSPISPSTPFSPFPPFSPSSPFSPFSPFNPPPSLPLTQAQPWCPCAS